MKKNLINKGVIKFLDMAYNVRGFVQVLNLKKVRPQPQPNKDKK
jgi:hypothetical protein